MRSGCAVGAAQTPKASGQRGGGRRTNTAPPVAPGCPGPQPLPRPDSPRNPLTPNSPSLLSTLLCVLLKALWAWHSHPFLPLLTPTHTRETTGATRQFQAFVHQVPQQGLSSRYNPSMPEPPEELEYTWWWGSLLLSPLPAMSPRSRGSCCGEGRPTLTRTCSAAAGLVLGI